jgi:hypothetical protein
MFDWIFREIMGEKFDVKMGKTGGGGLDVEKRQELSVKSVWFSNVFPQNSQLFVPLCLALRWSNFWW